jgi:hypothetical protein
MELKMAFDHLEGQFNIPTTCVENSDIVEGEHSWVKHITLIAKLKNDYCEMSLSN